MLLLAWSLAAAEPEVVPVEGDDDWADSALLLTLSLQPHFAWLDNELLRLPRKVVVVVAEVVVEGVVNAAEQLLLS